jgi:predicted nucleic-acid-binding protein
VLGVDTNVLVRFLTVDDEAQFQLVQRMFQREDNQPIYLSGLVLAEAFTVLTKVKKFPRDAVLDSFRLLLRSPQITVERSAMVETAIEDAARTSADFPDALIALQNADAGCSATATFDKRAIRLDAMRSVEDFS